MELQTELLENRMARLRVKIEADELETAKRQAARRLAKRVSIPGFRKGKAPYQIIARYLGEGAILEEALDQLGPEIYRQALDESGLEPYGPGQLENIESEDNLIFVFTVPLSPTVDLGDYRAVRLDFEEPEVTDEMVDEVLKSMQNSKAVIEPKDGPAAPGDHLTLDVYGELLPSEEEAAEDSPKEGGADEASDDNAVVFDQHEWTFILGDEENEPIPGFSAALEGITAGEERTFDLVIPDDVEAYNEEYHGRTVRFTVTCHEVAARHIPPLNDDFAQQMAGEDEDIETLLELRMKVREDLQKVLNERAEESYANAVLDKIVEQASIEFPEEAVQDYISDMIADLEQNLQQQGLTLKDFLNLNQMDEDTLREQYRESAIERLKHGLVLGEIVKQERLNVSDAAVDEEVKERSSRYSDGNPQLQEVLEQFFGQEQSRRDIAIGLLTQRAYKRIVEIGKGEAPPLDESQTDEAPEGLDVAAENIEETADAAEDTAEEAAS